MPEPEPLQKHYTLNSQKAPMQLAKNDNSQQVTQSANFSAARSIYMWKMMRWPIALCARRPLSAVNVKVILTNFPLLYDVPSLRVTHLPPKESWYKKGRKFQKKKRVNACTRRELPAKQQTRSLNIIRLIIVNFVLPRRARTGGFISARSTDNQLQWYCNISQFVKVGIIKK
jgi:hypothetical protein